MKNIANKSTFDAVATEPAGTIGRYESTTANGDFLYESQVRYVVSVGGTPTWVFLRGSYASKGTPSAATLSVPLGIDHTYFKYGSTGGTLEERYVPDGALGSWVPVPVSSSGGNALAPTAVSPQNFFVNENAPVGASVGTINATPAAGGPIIYALTGTSDFTINSSTGEITTAVTLNYAQASNYTITAYAIEGEAAKPITININLNQVVNDVTIFYTANANVLRRASAADSNSALTALGALIGDTIYYVSNAVNPSSLISERHHGRVIDQAGLMRLENISGLTISYALPTDSFVPEGLQHHYLYVANGGDFNATNNANTMYYPNYSYSGVSGGVLNSTPRWVVGS